MYIKQYKHVNMYLKSNKFSRNLIFVIKNFCQIKLSIKKIILDMSNYYKNFNVHIKTTIIVNKKIGLKCVSPYSLCNNFSKKGLLLLGVPLSKKQLNRSPLGIKIIKRTMFRSATVVSKKVLSPQVLLEQKKILQYAAYTLCYQTGSSVLSHRFPYSNAYLKIMPEHIKRSFRTMHHVKNVSKTILCNKPSTNSVLSNMSSRTVVKFKGCTVKSFANDGSGRHDHIAEKECNLVDCEKLKCSKLCGTFKQYTMKGHHTHKPPTGRIYRFIANNDAKGQNETQYFVKYNTKKIITAQEASKYKPSEIKENTTQKPFLNNNDEKYD